ncbi:MAG: helicase-related protein [Candidatus Saccharimonadales bacterium]
MPRSVSDFELQRMLDEHGMERGESRRTGIFIDLPSEIFDEPIDDETRKSFAGTNLGNPDLPIHNYREVITETVRDNPVTIIVAETGAGKSTQVPQYLLEEGYPKVYITQPRRPAARNVFVRMRDEISEVRGKFAGDDLVSYQTAAERQGKEDAPIKVVTDGLQLVCELHDRGLSENEVLIIDEAHEWNSNVEVLVAWTKKALADNPRLKVVIMSATMDSEHLANYYKDVCPIPPPVINVPGRMYKVEREEKPYSTVAGEVLDTIIGMPDEDGELPEGAHGILAFLPGKREIYDAIDVVRNHIPADLQHKVKIFPLHAKLSPTDQQAALTEYPGTIKVVFATDVAQTSLTIPDITHVIDSGYQRRLEVDNEGSKGLMLRPISIADSHQRAGRTGRVGDGRYVITRLNDTTPHANADERDQYPVPEILRTDIARNTLRLLALGLDIAEFDMYHKVSIHSIDIAKRNLKILGAVDDAGQITELGLRMNEYPLSASSARIMIEAERYSESTRAYLAAITAIKEVNGLQYFAHNVGKRWLDLTDEETSDLLAQLDIFIETQSMSADDIIEHDLDINNVARAHEQFAKIAKVAKTSSGWLKSPNADEREDIRRCIAAGYMHSIYLRDGDVFYHGLNPLFNKRELSNRSLVSGNSLSMVVGDPYNVELRDGEEVIVRHCIENATIVTAQLLGGVATSRQVQWQLDGFQFREGKVKQRERQVLLGSIDLGMVQEVPAVPSLKLRQTIIEYALEKPGFAQKELRAIKRELERLAHLSRSPVPVLTHDRIIQLVESAAPDDITTPSTIEDNLQMMLSDPNFGLSLDDFISKEIRREIIANAPPIIEVEDMSLKVTYRNGKPIVSSFNREKIMRLNEPIYLGDGREVLFMYKNGSGRSRLYGLFELQYKLTGF